ncbi:MAG: response regulator transcription factor [Bacteroidales bacterium]|nr:response regulator transcription factor [Bacteroidota bacterium]MBL6949780.1 response regulator transcription factor [Bacteroidales bacterium]
MKKKPRILYVEDDLTLSFVTRDNLTIQGYEIEAVDNGQDALEKTGNSSFDLCILDVMLPKMDGFTLAEKIREHDQQIPIIFVTARSTKDDKIHGLKIGGDDYITKPFSIEELILKIEVFLKRSAVQDPKETNEILTINDEVSWDSSNFLLVAGGRPNKLTHREADLFSFLLKHQGKIVKREELLIGIWGHDHFFSSRSLDVFISRLRKYLGSHGVEIENIYNVGYRFKTS